MIINKEFQIIESETSMFDAVLKILVFLSTLVCLPDRGLFVFEQMWFHVSVIILALAAFASEKQRDFKPWLLIGFNAVFILNVFTHNFNPIVMQYALNVFLLSLAIFLVASYTQNFRSVIKWIFASYVVTSVVLVFQLYGFNVLLTSLGEDSGGLMGNLPRLSFLACLVLPLAFKSKAKFLLIPLIMLSCGYVFPQYCIFSVFLICFWFRCGSYGIKAVIASCIALIFIYVYLTKPVSINLRIDYYFLILRDFFSFYWLSGFGAGIPFAKDIGARDMQTYSSILQFIFTTGIAGAIWLCFTCVKFFKSFRASALNLSILAFGIISIWEYPFEVRRLWFVLAVLIGFLIIENKENQRS
jgi:hypothetical protein